MKISNSVRMTSFEDSFYFIYNKKWEAIFDNKIIATLHINAALILVWYSFVLCNGG